MKTGVILSLALALAIPAWADCQLNYGPTAITIVCSSPTPSPSPTPLPTPTPPPPTPTPTPPPTPSPIPSPTLAPPTPTPAPTPVAHFSTLPPGAALPAEAWCAQQVNATPIAEVVAANAPFNGTAAIPTAAQLAVFQANPQPFKGDTQGNAYYARADGNFSGSTDMLIRNAACKWGFDEDVIRAQAQNESFGWKQTAAGDKRTAQTACVQSAYPQLQIWNTTVQQAGGNSVSCSSCCFQSWGLTQNKLFFEPTAFPMAVNSTAFTLDLTYATMRVCMDGLYAQYFAYQNTHGTPNTYAADVAAGDVNRMLWGCVGQHYSGGWYDVGAQNYISQVQTILANGSWPGGLR